MTLPERLGRLRRVDRIGAGGFATVWLYHDDDLDSPVAVKALADNWAQRDDVRERFLEEARMLRRADSEHVVRVYDIGEADQTPYFVMSYADLGSLATLTDAGPVDPARAVDLVSQAGEGVRVLHRAGIIHRDIKPQNLLLRSCADGDERVLVADLGVAKAMLHASGLTQVVGTPAYMAPEQAIGLGIDGRADVHALGAVAYHLMTGRFAREGGIADLASPHPPIPPSVIDPALAPYDDALLRSLEPRPEDRWPDVISFIGALRAADPSVLGTTSGGSSAPLSGAAGSISPAPAGPAPISPGPVSPPPSVPTSPATVAVPSAAPTGPAAARARRPVRTLLLVGACLIVLAAGFGAALGLTRAFRDDNTPVAGPSDSATGGGSPSGSTGPKVTPSPDIDYPPLGKVELTERHRLVAPDGSVWSYAVPAGWDYTVIGANGAATRLKEGQRLNQQTEVRWRPGDEQGVGGYSLRFQALDPNKAPRTLVAAQVAAMRSAQRQGNADEFTILPGGRTRNELRFSYIDSVPHLRYNFFRWLSSPSGNAGLEVSVAGRKADVPGLDDLLDAVVASVYPIS